MSSYVNSFTATHWCTQFLAQLKDVNEGHVRTMARALQLEHVLQVGGLGGRARHRRSSASSRPVPSLMLYPCLRVCALELPRWTAVSWALFIARCS